MAILIDFHWIMKFMATLGCNVDDSNLDGNEQQTSSKKRKSKASWQIDLHSCNNRHFKLSKGAITTRQALIDN